MKTLKIAIAGSSLYTCQIAELLLTSQNFAVVWIMGPSARPVGREQILSASPIQTLAKTQRIPYLSIDSKIEEFIPPQPIDIFLVVDFGYLVPNWLLKMPKLGALNIHPSLLPKWRGSSPGQFALLHRDLLPDSQTSAVTLMMMDETLDGGALLKQIPFNLQPKWTQVEYYQTAFGLICAKLTDLLVNFSQGKLIPSPQQKNSSTMSARRLKKADSFISFHSLQALMVNEARLVSLRVTTGLLEQLLTDRQLCNNRSKQLRLIYNACYAFQPWPKLWTTIETNQGNKRMQLLEVDVKDQQLLLGQVQIEGKTPCRFSECKNSLI